MSTSLAKHIVVRYRAEGHVRFGLPQELSLPELAQQLQTALRQAEGVYRVDLYHRQGKLSIRYIEGVTNFKAVARALYAIVSRLAIPTAEPANDLARAGDKPGVGDWFKAKYQEARETFTAMGIVADAATRGPSQRLIPDKEKFLLEFFTDILVLYLTKLHWPMITGEWMKRPWLYRYEWMATFYLIFLLVRSKRPK